MKFKELTDSDKAQFSKVYLNNNLTWQERMDILSEFIGKSDRTVRNWAVRLNLTSKEEAEAPELAEAKKRKHDKNKQVFFITWAQCDTPVHLPFFTKMLGFAEEHNADVHVIAGRYKNPTSIFSDKKHDRWSKILHPYLDAARHNVHKYVSIMSDIKIQPTAINPMSGMEGLSGVNSCVFGSPRVQKQTIPVLENARPKQMVTTGACTVSNYTDSKAGKKGEFHHMLGFVIVEIVDGETVIIRQVTADDNGDFCDLNKSVTFEGVEKPLKFDDVNDKITWIDEHCGGKPIYLEGKVKIENITKIEACILGDIHAGHHDPAVIEKTHEMLSIIKPKNVVLHDIFDGYSISHHEMKNAIRQYAKEYHGQNDLAKELAEMFVLLGGFTKYENVVIVRSNHDDFIDRWVINDDWKKQPTPKNNKLYTKFATMMMEEVETNPDNVLGVIPSLIKEQYPDFITLGRRDSFKIMDWEVGQHGDVGSNGSRGSLLQFRKLNTKIIVGHYHSPGRFDGAMAVGTSTHLRVGYNQGPSSWWQSHVIIHPNGKAQHIDFVKDKNGNTIYSTLL